MQSLEIKPLWLDVHSITLRVNHEEFEKLCQDNPDRSFESMGGFDPRATPEISPLGTRFCH
jgi:hypothetical protein